MEFDDIDLNLKCKYELIFATCVNHKLSLTMTAFLNDQVGRPSGVRG